jgi:enterochelin esterase-like enzyme
MGLTSKKVLLLAVLLAVALFALTVWLWPRLSRRAAVPVLGRVGVLAATQLSLIVALALIVNDNFGFYASWADLFGQETSPGVVVDQAAGGTGGELRVLDTLAVNVPGGAVPSVGGQIQKVVLAGGRSKISTTAYVYLPPEYFRDPQRVFPAAVVLTGYPGVADALYKKMKYPATAASLVRNGRAQPMVLVMLRPTVVPPRDTECMNVPHGPQTETFFTEDLHRALAGSYRVGTTGASWGAIGDSTGGYCALKFAMRHPGAYSAAVSLSGYYSSAVDMTTGDLFGGSKRLREENDLLWRLRHLPVPKVSLLVTSSLHGEYDYPATLRFISAVRPPMTIDKLILPSGGHNFTTWNRELPQAMRWLGGRLTVPAGPPGSA